MKKFLLIALAAASCALGSSAAQAAFVTLSEGGVVIASWTQSLTPTPLAFITGNYTQVAITNGFGLGTAADVYWYDGANGGGLSIGANVNILGGQGFSNPGAFLPPESAPIFLVGTYYGRDYGVNPGGAPATVTISVPEPATWGMMLVGLGLIGWAARRRQTVSVTYA